VTLYLESSAILSVYLSEADRHEVVQSEIEAAAADGRASICSALGLVEVRSGLARARFKDSPPRLSNAGYLRSLSMLAADWPNYVRASVSDDLVRHAANLAERHLLRAYDAMHLATALFVRDRLPGRLEVSTWDKDLARAASTESLALAHEVSP